jgi:hypothetical protein
MKEEQKQLSFLFYTSWKEQIEEMNDDELRRFVNNLINYHTGDEVELITRIDKIIWNGVLPALIKNQSNWNRKRTAAIENGKKGGRPSKPTETQDNLKNPMGYLETQHNPQKPVKSKVLNVNSQMSIEKSQMSNVNSQLSSVNSQVSSVNSQVSRSNSIIDNIIGANNLQGNRTWNSYLNSETEGQKTSMIYWINSTAKKNPQGKTKEEIATFNECKQIVELVPELFV